MAKETLTEYIHRWYHEETEEDLATLVFRPNHIMLGRFILAERLDDQVILLNAFHWPESTDTEAISVVEAVPWESLKLVFTAQSPRSLTNCKRYPISHGKQVIVHKKLGVGVVEGTRGEYTRCVLGGRERNFVTRDFWQNDKIRRLSYAFG